VRKTREAGEGLTARADRFAGANRKEKASARSAQNERFVVGRFIRVSSCSPTEGSVAEKKSGSFEEKQAG